jgi:citrate synthase
MLEALNGLEGVVVAHTVLSEVDGAAGRLIIRGETVETLSAHASFEDVIARLWEGFFPDLPADMTAALGAARAEAFATLPDLDPVLLALAPTEAARALTARLPDGDDVATALRLVAGPAVFTAAALRARRGERPLAPDPNLGHAEDILRLLRGEKPDPADVAALNAYLVTVSDHGLNASTFAARVTASTLPGLTSAVLSGISALKGPLHGGAPGPVIDMLNEIGVESNARAWLEAALARGDRLMGFGHRVYRVRDPRADALKAATARLAAARGADYGRLRFAEAVEQAALDVLRAHKPNRPLETNVELYTALLLEALVFPPEAFTCVFAMGRVAGWIAHAREQVATGRLIRPQSVYVGPLAA